MPRGSDQPKSKADESSRSDDTGSDTDQGNA